MLVITTCRNASLWIDRSLDSVARQTWEGFRCLVYDDASDDDTAVRVAARAGIDDRFRLRVGTTPVGAAVARWTLLAEASDACDSDIVVVLDGDDWFAGPNSLETLRRFADDHRLLASHGTFVHPDGSRSSWSRDYPEEVKRRGSYRSFDWVATHPRVFRYGLFRALADLPAAVSSVCDVTAATDMALFLPLLELAGEDTAHCPWATYVYNDHGGRVYGKRRIRRQRAAEARIRSRPALAPLGREARERLLGELR